MSSFSRAFLCVSLLLFAASAIAAQTVEYKLLATNKTSTTEKELNQAGAQGFEFVGVTVGQTAFGGQEVVSILRRVHS